MKLSNSTPKAILLTRKAILFLKLISISFLLSNCASQKKFSSLVYKNTSFDQKIIGVRFEDASTEQVIFEHNSDKYFTPASTTKLITFYVSSQILKDSITSLKYVEQGDSLIFWGVGDPTILYKEFPFQPAFSALKNSSKQLFFYANTPSTNKHFGSGWAWDDYQSNYSVEVADMPIYGNRVNFKYKSENDTLTVFPSYFAKHYQVSDDSIHYARTLSRSYHANDFHVLITPETEDFNRDIPFTFQPDSLVRTLLSDTLKKEIGNLNTLPQKNARSIMGYPTDSLYYVMLQESDNFIAEQFLVMSSYQLFDTLSTKMMISYAQKNLFADIQDSIRWVDGSGLSRYNLVTPRFLTDLLKKIYSENEEDRLFALLPAGGKSGTLKHWYPGEEKPYVFAKTGTLSNNHNISGYLITNSGRRIIFAMMANHYLANSSDIKKEYQRLLEFVRDHY